MDDYSVWWEITLLYFFSWNCTWFGQKEPIKGQNFRLSTAHVKIHQICTLIDSLKYKILTKKYRGVVPHDPQDWCIIWRKTDLLFQKWQEFGKIWPKHSKVSKPCTFICSYCEKYLMFDLRKYRGVIFHDTEGWCKIWRKTDLWFEKWYEEYGKFSPEPLKVSKLGLWFDPLIQSWKGMSVKSTEDLCHDNEEWCRDWRGIDKIVISKLIWGI